MMRKMRVPLQSSLLSFDGMILESPFQLRKFTSFTFSQNIAQSNSSSFQQLKLRAPSLSKCDSRLFHPPHSVLTLHNLLLGKNSSLSGQKPLKCFQNFPSVALHTSQGGNIKLFQSLPNVSSHMQLFNQYMSTHSQLRFLHRLPSRKRVSRPFSSQEKSPSAVDKEGGLKDGKESEEEDEKKLTVYQRFKKTYKEHGKVLVVVHLMTSAVWFGTFYATVRCGVDIVPLLESWNLSDKYISPFRSGGLGDVALAYLMYKLATPARYTVTVGGTHLAVRYLKKEGKMQQVPKEDSLRELYKDGKEDLKEKGKNTKHRLKHMRHRIQGRIRRVRKRHPHDRRDR